MSLSVSMAPFPYRKLYIETSLSLDEVVSRFHHNIETDKINKRMAGIPTRAFEGQLTHNSSSNRYEFELFRIGHLKHIPFRIEGIISETESKTYIEMQIELHFFYPLFLMIWVGIIVMSSVGQVLSGDYSMFSIGVLFVGIILFPSIYFLEVKKDIDILLEITQGKVFVGKTHSK